MNYKEYFNERTTRTHPGSLFFSVNSPLLVFKKITLPDFSKMSCHRTEIMCIANLVVPVGATIYAGDYYEVHHKDMASSKFRVSSAVCHSIATICDKQQQQVGYSNYSRFFKYDVNPKLAEQTKNSLHTEEKLFSKTVKPKGFIIPDRFSHADKVCDGGIHIFFSLRTAIRYNFS